MAKRFTKKLLAEAVVDVECSAMANNFGECSFEDFRCTAEFAAVDWCNERGIDNSNADTIVRAVMSMHGFT